MVDRSHQKPSGKDGPPAKKDRICARMRTGGDFGFAHSSDCAGCGMDGVLISFPPHAIMSARRLSLGRPHAQNTRESDPGTARDLGQERKPASRAALAVCCLLLAAVAVVFGQTIHLRYVRRPTLPTRYLAVVGAVCPGADVQAYGGNAPFRTLAAGLLAAGTNGRKAAVVDRAARRGRFDEAVQTARKALNLAKRQKNQPLAESISARIPLYEAGIPFREM